MKLICDETVPQDVRALLAGFDMPPLEDPLCWRLAASADFTRFELVISVEVDPASDSRFAYCGKTISDRDVVNLSRFSLHTASLYAQAITSARINKALRALETPITWRGEYKEPCGATLDDMDMDGQDLECELEAGHGGPHQDGGASWSDDPEGPQ